VVGDRVAKKRVKNFDGKKQRFFLAVALLVLIGLGISYFTNPQTASSLYQGLNFGAPTAHITFSHLGQDVTLEGMRGTYIFSQAGDEKGEGQLSNVVLKFNPNYMCRMYSETKDIWLRAKITFSLERGGFSKTFTKKAPFDEWKIPVDNSWPDGEYVWTITCIEEPVEEGYEAEYSSSVTGYLRVLLFLMPEGRTAE